MVKRPEIVQEEIKTRVAKRVPPGDRWTPLSNSTVVLDSLTDVLEFIYQEEGNYTVKSKLRKILTKLVIIYVMIFPKTDLVKQQKSLEELEDEGEIHIGI